KKIFDLQKMACGMLESSMKAVIMKENTTAFAMPAAESAAFVVPYSPKERNVAFNELEIKTDKLTIYLQKNTWKYKNMWKAEEPP
ncbi:43044_t:CDS:2, partial [Gigaspora margarita]